MASNITAVKHNVSRNQRAEKLGVDSVFRGATIWFTGITAGGHSYCPSLIKVIGVTSVRYPQVSAERVRQPCHLPLRPLLSNDPFHATGLTETTAALVSTKTLDFLQKVHECHTDMNDDAFYPLPKYSSYSRTLLMSSVRRLVFIVLHVMRCCIQV